jgi:fucose permease
VVIVSFFSFLVLGLPDGMLGIAWPSMSREFDKPLGLLGLLMLGFTIGYVATTSTVGIVARRIGYRYLFIAAALAMLIGGCGITLAPAWLLLIFSLVVLGCGAGWLDGGMNAYAATFFRPRDLNWVHAFYGVGATIGPMIMTPIVVSQLSWRWGYASYSLMALFMLSGFFLVRKRWNIHPNISSDPDNGPRESSNPTSKADSQPFLDFVMVGSIIVFFLYTGIEVVAGQWAFSLFTIGRNIEESVAGPWISAYWAALTVGRIVSGWVAERLQPMVLIRLCTGGATLGVTLLLLQHPLFLGAIGMIVLGFSLSALFPLLIGETPRRVGTHRADHAVGLQIAGANLGAVSMVAVVGVGVELYSLEIVGWVLLICVLLFALFNETVEMKRNKRDTTVL